MIVATVRRHAIVAIVAIATALLAPAGCHPQLPPVSGCAPHVYACHDGAPYVCSASRRWEPAGDIAPCPGACTINDAGVAFCAPLVDGGNGAR